MKEGQFVYELFSILIHSGGAHAGHYYAYIKDSANNQWYKFNDVMVYRISFLEIISTFGQNISKKKRYSNNVQNRSNAYMLMYRQIDPDFNVNEVPKSLISQELRDEVENDVTVEKIKLLERERKDNRMQLKVIYDDESKAFWVNRKEDPLTFLLLQAMKEFEIDNLEVSDCRLRAYNIVNKVMQETYTGKENQTFEELSIFPLKTLALETKKPEESFEELDPNQITLKVNKWIRGLTILDEDNLKPVRIKISKEETMEQLIEKLSNISEIPVENLRVFKRRAIGQGKNVEELSLPKNMNRKLKIIRINDGLNLFIENGSYDHPDVDKYNFLSKEMVKNKWETEFELDRNRFVIQFNIPVEDAQTDDQVKEKPDIKIDY
jgi:ubiquitin carboxyl-terminal hydrolase 47